MIKINKTKARKLYNEGITIHLLPCKVGLGSVWISPMTINNEGSINGFDKYVTSFENYNCNYECGYYTHYYIEE